MLIKLEIVVSSTRICCKFELHRSPTALQAELTSALGRAHRHTYMSCASSQTNAPTAGLTGMATLLEKTLKREVRIGDRSYIVAISPLTLKLTPKGKRRGLELNWESLVSGDTALAAALDASVGRFTADEGRPKRSKPPGGPTTS